MKVSDLENGDFFISDKINLGGLCQYLISSGTPIIAFPLASKRSVYGYLCVTEKLSGFQVEKIGFMKDILSHIKMEAP